MAQSRKTPRLVPDINAQAKANTTAARVDNLAGAMATENSPVRVYKSAAAVQQSGDGTSLTGYTWTCPTGINSVQVECYGGGGAGGGGGPTAQGGGAGGGGGEYACEPNYPVVPGEVYSFFAGKRAFPGLPDVAGSNNAPGMSGLDTVFDPRGKGITGGVIAHGGQGGDQGGVGVPGKGGSGSVNTIHFDGGQGGGAGGNVFSDNPWNLMTDSLDFLHLWYRLDESTGVIAYDYSDFSRASVQVYKTAGAFLQPTKSGGAPSQVPVIGDRSGNPIGSGEEAQGYAWKIDKGTAGHGGGYILAPSFGFGGPTWTTLTVSIWIKGLPTAASSSDWGSNTTPGQHSVLIGNADTDAMSNGGYYLGINNAGQATFTVRADNGVTYFISGGSPSATDGNWHMITGVFHNGGTMNLYVDGAQVATTSPAGTYFTTGPQPVAIGMDRASSGYYYNGYVSNAYVSRELFNSTQVGQAYGSVVSVGGGGGGASGGSAGAGNDGSPGSGTTGGAGGAGASATNPGVNNGSAAGVPGGTGANTGGTDGAGVAPFGGAGGGSASYTSSISGIKIKEVDCLRSASYCGFDAQGGFAGSMYTVSEDPSNDSADPYYSTAARQDGISYTGGQGSDQFNGSMNTILNFPSLASVVGGSNGTVPVPTYLSDSTQWDIIGIFLNLTIETPNACTIYWREWKANNLPDHVDDTVLSAGGFDGSVANVIRIPAGEAGRRVQVLLDDDGTLASDIQLLASSNGFGGMGVGLLLGSCQGSTTHEAGTDGAWDSAEAPDWYCSLHGAEDGDTGLSASLTIRYAAHNAYTTIPGGGRGDPGYIVISYITPEGTPVATVLTSPETDANGHQIGQGFTADATNWNVWQPGSNPRTLETWHTVTTSLTGWSQHSGGTPLRYRLMPGNMLWVQGTLDTTVSATSGTLFTLPSGWRPPTSQLILMWNDTAGAAQHWYCKVASDGEVMVSSPGGATTLYINGLVSLDS